MPRKIRIVAIEAECVLDFDERCTRAVEAALPHAAVAALEEALAPA